jgi:hypothetical protein
MENMNFDDVLSLSPEELIHRARTKGWAASAVGWIVYAVLRIFRQTPQTFEGICPYFVIGKGRSGLELGWFFVCGKNASRATHVHEVGHIIQNAKVGGLKVLGLSICSAVRFWTRRIVKSKSAYDSWWFEGQATALGTQYLERIKETQGKEDPQWRT